MGIAFDVLDPLRSAKVFGEDIKSALRFNEPDLYFSRLATDSSDGALSDPDAHASLRAVTSLVSAHLQSLAQQLPEGEIRSAIERTIGHFVAFDVEAALSPSGSAEEHAKAGN